MRWIWAEPTNGVRSPTMRAWIFRAADFPSPMFRPWWSQGFCRAPVVMRPERTNGPARWVVLRSHQFGHGLMEGSPEDMDEEIDGVAGQLAFGPAPIRVFHDEAGKGGHQEVAATLLDQLMPAFFEQRHQRPHPRVADLFAGPRPPLLELRGVGHSLSSSGVG